jgi:hypothetical protein
VDEEVWATAYETDGEMRFVCDHCGHRVGHDTLLRKEN